MKIPTVNIVVGFNKEVMERLFVAGATYKSLIQDLSVSGEETLLFDNVSNPNFISFEHSMNMGSGWKMLLTFIDPEQKFENRYISDNIVKNIAGFSYNDSKNVGKNYNQTIINKKIQESQEEFGDQYTAEFLKEYVDEFSTKEIYVAYGTGDNLDLWAGPHRTVLVGVDISVEGARKLTIKLQPSAKDLQIGHRKGAYNEKINFNLAGLTMRTAGDSRPIQFYTEKDGNKVLTGPRYDPLEWLDFGGVNNPLHPVPTFLKYKNEQTKKVLESVNLDFVASQIGKLDFHSIIVDALREYIQNATNNPNVIVLLPNINITCSQWMEESAKNARVIQLDASTPADVGAGFGNFQGRQYLKRQLEVGFEYYYIQKLLESFCLELIPVEEEEHTIKAIPNAAVSNRANYENSSCAQESYMNYFKRKFVARIQGASDNGIPDHVAKLKSVTDRILQYSKENYQFELANFTETDTNILNLWTEGVGSIPTYKLSTFGGYASFNESKEAIIFGDQAMIQEYLYGRMTTKTQGKNVADLQKKAALAESEAETLSSPGIHQYAQLDDPDSATSYKDKAAAEKKSTAATIASLLAIPLHPLDQIALTDSNYNTAIRKISYPPMKGVGSFGDISYLIDDFAYEDVIFKDIEKKHIEEAGVPIFRYNTQNPNILDMNFKFAPIYFASLEGKCKKMVKRKASGVAEGVLPVGIGSFPIRSRGAAQAYLKQKGFAMGLGPQERQDLVAELARLMTPELVESLDPVWFPNPQKAAKGIAATLKNSEKFNYASFVEVEQTLPGNPQTLQTDFMEDVYRRALQMTIKTLPFFHLSAQHTMGRECIVFAQETGIKQSSPPNRTLLNSFFSGIYKIMGFKHTISTGSCESEFRLLKNAPKYSSVKKEEEVDV
jgi:hypothetical protein